jgi:hypothetical protein
MKFTFVLLLLASPAFAQSVVETTGINQMLDRAPTSTDVLLELHQFDLFQQNTTDSADKRGDAAVKKFALAESAAAETRDQLLTSLAKKAALKITFPEEPSAALETA